jgi:hypothetical protein
MRRTLFVLAVFLPISSFGQSVVQEIPMLSEVKARLILQEIWPTYAMQDDWASGPRFNWLRDSSISILTEKGGLKLTRIGVDSFSTTINDTLKETLQLHIGEIVRRTSRYTGDSLRHLMLFIHSIGDTVKASIAWMPVTFLWLNQSAENARMDSLFGWVKWAVQTAIPDQYVASDTSWKRSERADYMLTQILSSLSTPQSALFERATKKVPADLIDMEAGSIFVSYNSSTQTLTYLRRK